MLSFLLSWVVFLLLLMCFSGITKSHHQPCRLKNVDLESVASRQSPWWGGRCDTLKQCPGECEPRPSLHKEACSTQYKPNSIKNAIHCRFQIKAKYYRNLTVLEKASLKHSHSPLPYQGKPFSFRISSMSQCCLAAPVGAFVPKEVENKCYHLLQNGAYQQC